MGAAARLCRVKEFQAYCAERQAVAMMRVSRGQDMANHVSALKRYKQSQKRRVVNGMNRQKLKTQIKKLRIAIQAGNTEEAQTLLPKTFSVIDKSVQKGVIKANAAERYKSRMNRHLNAIATPAA
jgi:small subunit ribosomal protein S20